MPSELTEKITRLRAAGDDESQKEAARLEREAEKASKPKRATTGGGDTKTTRKSTRKR